MTQFKTVFAAAALAAGLAACNNPESAPEPENEVVAETMPETPDMGTAGQAATTAPPAETQEPAPAPAG